MEVQYVPPQPCSSCPSRCQEEVASYLSPEALYREVTAICPTARRRWSDGWLTGVTITFEAWEMGLPIPVLWIRNRTCPLFVSQFSGNRPQVGETWTGCEIDPEGFIYPVYPPGVIPDNGDFGK